MTTLMGSKQHLRWVHASLVCARLRAAHEIPMLGALYDGVEITRIPAETAGAGSFPNEFERSNRRGGAASEGKRGGIDSLKVNAAICMRSKFACDDASARVSWGTVTKLQLRNDVLLLSLDEEVDNPMSNRNPAWNSETDAGNSETTKYNTATEPCGRY